MVKNIGVLLKSLDAKQLRKDMPEFNVGDSVKMMVKVQEGDKVRLHPFEGTVISKTGRGFHATFTVRKVSFGEGVERIFPIHSPVIESMKVTSRGEVNKAKLYYLRTRVGKGSRVKKAQEQQSNEAPVVKE
ncbi:MAG: 50S ribosomal protein L19 [Candidatus Omnitrophica bacterium]|nr:50S ribosomal protein L19 [Candidatus Omnitrophota bacterium]